MCSGYVGGTTSFQDVICKSTGELFCAVTPNQDASQVWYTQMSDFLYYILYLTSHCVSAVQM